MFCMIPKESLYHFYCLPVYICFCQFLIFEPEGSTYMSIKHYVDVLISMVVQLIHSAIFIFSLRITDLFYCYKQSFCTLISLQCSILPLYFVSNERYTFMPSYFVHSHGP